MAIKYEVGRRKDLRIPNTEYYFFVRIYNSVTEKEIEEVKEHSPVGLARKVLEKFQLEEINGDHVKSKMEKEIKHGIGTFPVSDEELIEFYIDFKETSMLRSKSNKAKNK